jgi:hypothetical protein
MFKLMMIGVIKYPSVGINNEKKFLNFDFD